MACLLLDKMLALESRFYILIEKVANAFAGKVVACSHSEKELLISHGIKNVIVINNGIKVSETEPDYKIPGQPLVFGTVGRITYQKILDYSTKLQCISKMIREYNFFGLVMANYEMKSRKMNKYK